MRRKWIEPNIDLPIAVQCILAGVARSTYYTQQRPAVLKDEDQLFLRLIDEEYTRHPYAFKRIFLHQIQRKPYMMVHRGILDEKMYPLKYSQ